LDKFVLLTPVRQKSLNLTHPIKVIQQCWISRNSGTLAAANQRLQPFEPDKTLKS
jgi:hypothetical protein